MTDQVLRVSSARSARSTPSIVEEEDPVGRALRKKKHVIASELHLTPALLADLTAQNIITQEALAAIKTLESNMDKVNLLVDFALSDMTKDQFDVFLDFIRSNLGDAYDDIEAEIIMERGLLIIEESVRIDASAAVHRCFGSSKRFSETDKRNVTDVLASKMQMTKLLWKARMNKLVQENQALKNTQLQWDHSFNNIHKEIDRFLRRNEFALFDFSVDMKSTTQALMVENSDEDKVNKLAKRTSYVLQKFGQTLMEKETYVKDRDKSLSLLKVKPKDPSQSFYNTLQKFMKENDKKITNIKWEVKSQKRRIKELEYEITTKDGEVEVMMKKLADQQSELETLKGKFNNSDEIVREGSSDGAPSEAAKIVFESKKSTLISKSMSAKSAIRSKTAGLKANIVY